MLPQEIQLALPELFFNHFGEEYHLRTANMLGGGSINYSLLLKTNLGDYFLKYNLAGKFPNMFELEAKGLMLIDNTLTIKTPGVCFSGETQRYTFLLMEYIPTSYPREGFFKGFAQNLALLHQQSSESFGLEYDNFIGSLKQQNSQNISWKEFFINNRILPLLKLSMEAGLLDTSDEKAFQRLFHKLEHILPIEKPSLLHGDLWAGNFLCNTFGEAYVIDPAVYYGSREMDIAMTRLFGGFADEFYEAYNYYFPLQPGWIERMDICNLYPLLVHIVLFGAGYTGQLRQIVSRF